FATTFKATVGSGFIALPYAIEAAGLVGGAVMIILVWLCTSITTKQLVMCSSIVNQKDPSILARKVDYGAIGYSAYGQKGRLVCILPVLITQFIAGVSFLVFIESTFDPLISQSYSPFFVMGVVICIQLALAMAPDPGFMVPIANIGNLAFFAAIGFAFYYGMAVNPPSLENVKLFQPLSGLMICFGIACYTFSAHSQAVSIYGTAGPKAKSSYLCTIDVVLIISAFVYLAFAVFNYLCYGSDTSAIIFDNLGNGMTNQTIKISLALMLMTNFPISVYPVHQSLELALGLVDPTGSISTAEAMLSTTLNVKQVVARLVIIISQGLVALLASNSFGPLVALQGGFNGIMAFVNPPIMHMALCGGWANWGWQNRITGLFLVVLGLVGSLGALKDAAAELLGK
ncbi:unnamed protein product, partial [Heterosigma akashiwo]